jgi:hypothetical protein
MVYRLCCASNGLGVVVSRSTMVEQESFCTVIC